MVKRLTLSDVGVAYGKRRILDGITTPAMTGGEVVAVIGPNAAGKSSLFRRIAGLIAGDGAVKVESATGKTPCYLPQDTAVNAVLTVYESILLARKQGGSWGVGDDELSAIDEALHALDIADLAFRGLGELSGGQRQLVSIAQTLVRRPEIMLLDEPTSALDVRRQLDVMATIREATRRRDIVTVVAIHDLSLAARFADRVLVMNSGRIAQAGAPAEVLAHEAVSETYAVGVHLEHSARGTLLVEPYIQVH